MTRFPDFDDLVGQDVPGEERERLRRAHDLLIEAGPPPELSPELESVPWPDDALAPLWGRRRRATTRRRPLLVAAVLATAVVVGFLLGQSTGPSSRTSIDARQTLQLHGTALAPGALATLKLGQRDAEGNWPMVLRVRGLPQLPKDGYYDLYLTRGGKPLVSCGTFNVKGETVVPLSAAYNLERFDHNGWVIVRKTPGHFKPTQIVLSASV
jgi:Anti-sigma-K factor rskA, C-terminal